MGERIALTLELQIIRVFEKSHRLQEIKIFCLILSSFVFPSFQTTLRVYSVKKKQFRVT